MNIFVTNECPTESARYLDSKRVVKMVLESCQLLCNVFHENSYAKNIPYKLTHKSHPCTLWAVSSKGNYKWLYDHAIALCKEYTKRYNKTHKCEEVLKWCLENEHKLLFLKEDRTEFVNCAKNNSKGLDFTSYKNVCLAYRNYLNARWKLESK